MAKIQETGLVIRRETKFDKIRKSLFMLFFRDEYEMIKMFDKLVLPKRTTQINKIVIPREIGKDIKKY